MPALAITHEQKMVALTSLDATTALKVRPSGKWYVTQEKVDIQNEHTVESIGGSIFADSPQDAIDRYFEKAVSNLLVVSFHNATERRFFRWNGFMWKEESHP